MLIQRLSAHKLTLVVLVCIAVRLAALLVFDEVFAFDQTGAIHGSDAYDAYAQNLLDSGVYGRTLGVPDASIPPFYSYVLAGVYALFGRGYLQVGLFHTLIDVACIVMLYHIAKCLLPQGEWVGALAGLFYAVYPYLVFQNLTLIDTPLFMFWLHAFVLLMVLLRERPTLDTRTWLIASLGGLVLGLSMLTRPIMPPLALFIALWFIFRLNLIQTILRLLPVALIGGLVLLPWIARNYAIYDAFVPMTTTSGANFWQGNSEYTVRYFRAGYDVQWTAPELQTEDLNSREADAERFAVALQFLRDNPDKIPELLWVKLLVYWSIDVTPRLNPIEGQLPPLNYDGTPINEAAEGELDLGGLPPGDPVGAYSTSTFDAGRIIHRYYFGLMVALALIGIVVSVRHWREVSLLWFVQISMTIVYVAFHPSTRYRVPTDPLLFVFSAYAVVWVWTWLRSRERTAQQQVATS